MLSQVGVHIFAGRGTWFHGEREESTRFRIFRFGSGNLNVPILLSISKFLRLLYFCSPPGIGWSSSSI